MIAAFLGTPFINKFLRAICANKNIIVKFNSARLPILTVTLTETMKTEKQQYNTLSLW